jgi:FtsP/CotA-like multicopper oxidase with cupredoxin domain
MEKRTRRDVLEMAVLSFLASRVPVDAAEAQAAPFREPPVVRGPEFDLVAAPARLRVAGQDAALFTYGGSFPGPTLRLREETVRLRLTNRLGVATDLHWHGLHSP